MSYASRLGRARISAKNPQAAAVCDRCGGVLNHVYLSWQFDWAGAGLINKRLLVCRSCTDTPQQQLRSIVLPADPPVVMNARPQDYVTASTDRRVTSGMDTVNLRTGIPVPGGDVRITEGQDVRVTQQTGFASGSLNNFPGTDRNAPGDIGSGLPYNNVNVPEAGMQTYLMDPWADTSVWDDTQIWSG